MVSILRSALAVLVGYAVFAASAFAIFRVSGQDHRTLISYWIPDSLSSPTSTV